ncbi:MAG: alanine--tRNA ligase [Candidatus Paceibacterota bacterium]
MLTSSQLRQQYLDFFAKRDHVVIPSSPLVPENDPTTLFTSSGMQPIVPYLLGAKHPQGTRIADSQKCFRSQDIEEVGDNRHTTFFEMLGNWSLGDYFKEEQLAWIFEFLVGELKLDPARLYVTAYGGDQTLSIPRDDQTTEIWQKLFASRGIEAKIADGAKEKGLQASRIFFYEGAANWWSRSGEPANMPVGEPGGPDSEIFFDFGADLQLHENSQFKDQQCHVNCDCGRFLEIGNSVFMQYQKTAQGFEPLPQLNIDFGGGLERMLAAVHNEPDVFKIDLFTPIIEYVEQVAGRSYQGEDTVAFRVIADHMRAAVMLIADGVLPDNKDQGYFVRRLIRRSVRFGKQLGITQPFLAKIAELVGQTYPEYPQVLAKVDLTRQALHTEEQKFLQTLERGLQEFEKQITVGSELTGQLAFTLYETYGFPLELSIEEAQQKNFPLAEKIEEDFQSIKDKHAEQSRTASVGMFKGGLADHSEATVQYHTATHLLHSALRQILGDHVEQKGSNITGERLRFDFTHPQALTEEEKQQIEQQINDWIVADLPITKQVMNKAEALKVGALAFFAEKYPDEVNVYTIGRDAESDWVSKELCGGPHVASTGEIGRIKIFKEKAVAAGIRRLYLQLI